MNFKTGRVPRSKFTLKQNSMTGIRTVAGLSPSMPGMQRVARRQPRKRGLKPLDSKTKERLNNSLNRS